MAIPSTAVFEYRAEGDTKNGGFFNSVLGGTDYSQQDTAQLALTDIQTDAAGTGVYSATGGFTAAMVGNGIYLTGGNGALTSGWYEITAYTDTNNITIDRSAGASKGLITGGTGNVGGALTLGLAVTVTTTVAGNVCWFKKGSYTAGANFPASNASEALSIKWIGYNTTRGDTCDGDNRPLIAMGAYYWSFGNYNHIRNFRFTGTAAYNFALLYAGYAINIAANNSSATSDREATRSSSVGCSFFDCDLQAVNGAGIYTTGNALTVQGCYLHDSKYGVRTVAGGGYYHILFNIFDTLTYGVEGTSGVKGYIGQNSFYACSTYGVGLTTGDSLVVVNNTFSGCGKGISLSADHQGENFQNWNNFYNNTTDIENIDAGITSYALDPKFTDAAGGDFSLQSSSGLIDKGFSLRLGVG